VKIDVDAIPSYAHTLDVPPLVAGSIHQGTREDAIARTLILDAINFGSGWFPTLKKRDGLSGFRTIAKGLEERFEAHGPWSPEELVRLNEQELASTLGQDRDHPLLPLFVASLRDLGAHGDLTQYVGGSAIALVEELATWPCFEDVSTYDELKLPFLKRAQIAAADLHRAGAADFGADLHRLTIFADNLVPHVLVLDGILELDPELQAMISTEQLLEHGSRPEVELRACAVHAAELIVAELPGVSAAALDTFLWERGGGAHYKAHPRPRCRTTAY